jgi:hypothetical protein
MHIYICIIYIIYIYIIYISHIYLMNSRDIHWYPLISYYILLYPIVKGQLIISILTSLRCHAFRSCFGSGWIRAMWTRCAAWRFGWPQNPGTPKSPQNLEKHVNLCEIIDVHQFIPPYVSICAILETHRLSPFWPIPACPTWVPIGP